MANKDQLLEQCKTLGINTESLTTNKLLQDAINKHPDTIAAKAKVAEEKEAEKQRIAAAKALANKGKIIYTSNGNDYEVKGKKFVFKSETYTAEEAVKNEQLMEALVKNQSPAIVKQ